MAHLLDSNILIRQFDIASPLRAQALSSVESLIKAREDVVIFPQVVIEFWSVVTRPIKVNGLGWTPAQAEAAINNLPSAIRLIPETSTIFEEWRRLVVALGVSGKNVHDAKLVAAMNVHQISHILTFNEEDFRRYAGIVIVRPT